MDLEKKKETNRRYRVAHREERRVYLRKWRQDNRSKCLSDQAEYRKANPDKQYAYGVTSRKKRPDRLLIWQRKNVGKVKASCAAYQTRKAGGGGSFSPEEWFTLCFAVGFRCLCCNQVKPLEPDHVLPVSMGGSSFLHNIQPLCRSCNASKNDRHIDYRSWGEKEPTEYVALSPTEK